MNIVQYGGLAYIPEAKAIIAMRDSSEQFTEPTEILKIGNYEIIPWGEDNLMPETVVTKSMKSEVIQANLEFNVLVGYGMGIKPMKRIIENNKIVGYEDIVSDEKVLDWCFNNDLQGYFLEQMNDLKTFYNVFPEVILSKDKKQIVQIRSKEAMYSRWGKMDKKTGAITKHYYSSKWSDNPGNDNIDVTDVLDRHAPLIDLNKRLAGDKYKQLRFIVPVSFPSPGRFYYQQAPWWSLFLSGWYDFSIMVPAAKKALMKNRFAVKYIIYISPKYFTTIFKEEGIDRNDEVAVKKRIDEEHKRLGEFLSGAENAGKAIVALKEYVQTTSGGKEEKYIEVEHIKNDNDGGEFVDDSEEVSNITSYVMGVHSSLIGSTPGKSKGSFSGTDKRELFMMKQSLMKPFRDRLLRPLEMVRRFNNWDKNIVWVVPDIEFTTLDQNKSGKQETLNQ